MITRGGISSYGRCTVCFVASIVLFSCGSLANGRNVFSDETIPSSSSSDQQNPNLNMILQNATHSDRTYEDGLRGGNAVDDFRGSFSESLNEHFRKLQQTFGLLDLRPKEACSTRRDIHMFYCPTPNPRNFRDWSCIRIDELCNGLPDCPGAEDEDPTLCMFWLAGQEQLRILKKIIVAYYQSDAEDSPASRPFE